MSYKLPCLVEGKRNMSLRSGAVEAIAEVLWMMDKSWHYQHQTPWAVESKGQVDVFMAKATVAFDTALAYLGEHTEEWTPSVVTIGEPGYSITIGTRTLCQELLAVLGSGLEETT